VTEPRGKPEAATGGMMDAYDRYARVLAAQLNALRTGEPDLDRFHELADERERIAKEIESGDPESTGRPDRAMLAARMQELRALDRQVLERLRELRTVTVDALTGIRERTQDRNSYLATARARTEPAHFDIRF